MQLFQLPLLSDSDDDETETIVLPQRPIKPNKPITISIANAGHETGLLQTIIQKNNWVIQEKNPDIVWQLQGIKDEPTKQMSKRNRIAGVGKLMQKCKTAMCFRQSSYFSPEEYDFHPKSYDTYADFQQLMLHYQEASKNTNFIAKPNRGSQGKGIFFIKNLEQLISRAHILQQDYVVQQYIENPMLIKGRKFDLRVYALITSLDPYICYMNKEGLVRICTAKYSSKTTYKNQFAHITNYAVNQSNSNYQHTAENFEEDVESNKLSFNALRQCLKEMGRNPDLIFKNIEKTVVGYLKCLYPYLLIHHNLSPKDNFAIIGLDILIDSNEKLWLLEGNSSPSLSIHQGHQISPLDFYVKQNVVQDSIKIANMSTGEQLSQTDIGSYHSLNHDYLLETNQLVELQACFRYCLGKTPQKRLSSNQFCKLSKLQGLANHQNIRADYENSFLKALTDKSLNKMNFFEFVEAIRMLAQTFNLTIAEFSTQIFTQIMLLQV